MNTCSRTCGSCRRTRTTSVALRRSVIRRVLPRERSNVRRSSSGSMSRRCGGTAASISGTTASSGTRRLRSEPEWSRGSQVLRRLRELPMASQKSSNTNSGSRPTSSAGTVDGGCSVCLAVDDPRSTWIPLQTVGREPYMPQLLRKCCWRFPEIRAASSHPRFRCRLVHSGHPA